MSTLSSLLIHDHRACDERFAAVESHVQAKKWAEAATAWSLFEGTMRCHFGREEDLVFPAFEQATGNTQGPTAVMRMEHDQMRALFDQLNGAVGERDDGRFLGLSESLMLLIQQHNMKEEQVLYPMCDQVLPGQAELIERVTARQPEQS